MVPLLGRMTACLCALVFTAIAYAEGSANARLLADYARLEGQLAHSAFGRPILLESKEEGGAVHGDVRAVLDKRFADVSGGLANARGWCEILLLPFNTKYCETSPDGRSLTVHLTRKYTTPLEQAMPLTFKFEVPEHSRDYMKVRLTAAHGPFATRDYDVFLEAVPLDAERTFLHLGYSYGYGAVARMAISLYLSTVGRAKVGFSTTGVDDRGNPVLIGGLRGVMERNTMRYYLAVESYIATLRAPPSERTTRLINAWFDAVERYPRQLHELERQEYVPMKEREFQRLTAVTSPPALNRDRRTASSSPSPS